MLCDRVFWAGFVQEGLSCPCRPEDGSVLMLGWIIVFFDFLGQNQKTSLLKEMKETKRRCQIHILQPQTTEVSVHNGD